ncbi:MAG: hypothetical protein A3G18_06005 [Rhodospirillales bacterium RIFCSPLOWO2_12_FULL_58_28]|nr:MAG: hypothetical protein A3H92_06010 [Rhodospirillales bacterium RIFCSPLOWO2_02_FULL_58_16]OHC77255.1 MAG: hypothetical protein A3G18_06005 [Rhodospirillales bacterium RIFCSPLOWO2_12_FULL_58_28]
MTAVPFDTLRLARKLEAAGFQPKQAADTAEALAEAMAGADLVTKDYLDLRLRDLEQRMIIRLGTMQAILVAVVAALVKLL